MRLKYLCLFCFLLIFLSACSQEDNINYSNKIKNADELKTHNEINSYQVTSDFTPDAGRETIYIFEFDDLDHRVRLVDSSNKIIYESRPSEVFGNYSEIGIVDYNDDGLSDLLITMDPEKNLNISNKLFLYEDGNFILKSLTD